MDFETELTTYLRARFPLIVLLTTEEERALQAIQTVCEANHRPCLTWDVGDNFQVLSGDDTDASTRSTRDPKAALEVIDQAEGNAVYILRDFHDFWDKATVRRHLRNVIQRLAQKSIIVTTPSDKIPDALRNEAASIEFLLPNAAQLDQELDKIEQIPGVRFSLTPLGRDKLVQAALGLTATQARRVLTKAVVQHGALDERSIDVVTEEKKQVIRQSEALEFYATSETPEDVGGLGVLKEWLRLRERAFTQEARDYGLPAPKGISLIGIPGTGKSLTAKMIGSLWRLPLLRLDVGALFGSLVGESERRTRRALQLAETIAPAIVWIDELEKGMSYGGHDSGTSSRVFGTILTWMQEKTAPCFVVATANNIASLPPELLRKGRFDEIFFLDLPTTEERRQIFAVHLRKRGRFTQDFDLARLAEESAGYVGAEIEQAIIDAMYVGFNDEGREFTTADISAALKQQVPLSVSQRETINALRQWLKEGRAQSASFRELDEAAQQFVPLSQYRP